LKTILKLFLDRNNASNGSNPQLPGHSCPHLSEDGLKNEVNYQYYLRCVNRFRKLKEYKGTILFVIAPYPVNRYSHEEKKIFYTCLLQTFPNAWLLFCEQVISEKRTITIKTKRKRRLITCLMELQNFLPDDRWAQDGNWDLWDQLFQSLKFEIDKPAGKLIPSVVNVEGEEYEVDGKKEKN
jgi:hypothetical protein